MSFIYVVGLCTSDRLRMLDRLTKLPSVLPGGGLKMSLMSIVGLCTSDRLQMPDRFTKIPSTPPGGGW
jgi:hypothetical protein